MRIHLISVQVQDAACGGAARGAFPADAHALSWMPKYREQIFEAIDSKRSRSHDDLLWVQLRIIVISEFVGGEEDDGRLAQGVPSLVDQARKAQDISGFEIYRTVGLFSALVLCINEAEILRTSGDDQQLGPGERHVQASARDRQ